jgi:hypothetical protein
MINWRKLNTLAVLVVALFTTNAASAYPVTWWTDAGLAAWTFNLGNATVSIGQEKNNANSAVVFGNTIRDGAYTLTYSGEGAAQRGVLRSYAYFGATAPDPGSCYGCSFPIGYYGVNAVSHSVENGVMAVGPQGSLGGIATYAVTFNLDGCFFNHRPEIYANLDDATPFLMLRGRKQLRFATSALQIQTDPSRSHCV